MKLSDNPYSKRRSWTSYLFISVTLLIISILLLVPLFNIFAQAFNKGFSYFQQALVEPDTASAVILTLKVMAITLPLNLVFGLFAAWCLVRFEFPGKNLLTSVVDLPLSISPVVVGLILVLTYGTNSPIGQWFESQGIQIIFATPGIVLATHFVSMPMIVRELMPVLQAMGTEEEDASYVLGVGGFKTFLKVTLPHIKWALIYGSLLATARAMGEFGAVSVVSGHIRGLTNTMPLHVEVLYNEYNFTEAFSVAATMTLFAVVTIFVKQVFSNYQSK
ncbi:MAG: sulfate ABC transporter permease subunit CysW [Bacilli bacterium]